YRFKRAEKEIIPEDVDKSEIKASDLTVKSVDELNYDNGKKVQVTFEPIELLASDWDITYTIFVNNDTTYLRSHVDIKSSNQEVAIDYIDVDKFVLPNDVEGLFHHPPLKEISSMWIRPNELMLGQPIYANGMFFGSEFPASDTDV